MGLKLKNLLAKTAAATDAEAAHTGR